MIKERKLKMALVEKGFMQKDFCRLLKISDSIFSRMLSGLLRISKERKKMMAALLGKSQRELFKDNGNQKKNKVR
jgi:transcriptional regulator with XRE-family HTH domain